MKYWWIDKVICKKNSLTGKLCDVLIDSNTNFNLLVHPDDGAKTATQKSRALDRIKSDPDCTILLISLKCGSVGLNLTCCSRVVLMDPWWNPAIESQAFDRVHRLGQTEDVCFKITIADTIEDRVLELQEEKQSYANQALGMEASTKMNKLSMDEFLHLFKM
ncbi:hypothetical protein MJO28_002534 [Puccinia striiformis f. sp. tritici]|uniref:Uncharacterized protein n=1 Tax=Puccinia striiformis f. sp. tritici TaxID=168172 RepID=A0ACC0ERM2_9BASI|nr:hypothetical protein MJO28_002534 [Puccinia striiformis f. sp. tritici]KAI7964510.1 hypothetical protein MJO29_002608 [Puccinia striiformis f. sp. tritici]